MDPSLDERIAEPFYVVEYIALGLGARNVAEVIIQGFVCAQER